jgi:penicillin-binding protein 2
LKWLLFCALLFFGGLTAKLADIQLMNGPVYSCLAFRQQAAVLPLEEYPRGSILDRNGVSLTGERKVKRAALFPASIKDEDDVAAGLASIFHVPVQEIKKRMQGDPYTLPYSVNAQQEAAVKQAGWAGVEVVQVRMRYGQRPLAAHVVGYLGKIESNAEWRKLASSGKMYAFGDYVGKAGCEHLYEHLLKGTVPSPLAGIYRDALGRTLDGLGVLVQEQRDGSRADVVLTLDAKAQRIVEEEMEERIPRGAVVVLEAGSGDILAVASRPSFHPADLKGVEISSGEEVFFDRAFAPYPPGSVFKILVGAAALEKGIAQDAEFLCGGKAAPFVRCWNSVGHGAISFAEAFAQSCNPAFAEIGLQVGKSTLLDYWQAFALDDRSVAGYPLPRDPRQAPSSLQQPYNLVNLSIGQGPVLVTPVQVAAMVNAVVNDGVYVKPRLVKGFRTQRGEVSLPGDSGRQVIKVETARSLRELLALSTRTGTGQGGYLETGGSAGKTGTAEGIADSKYAWFAGYAPLDNPRYVVVVMHEGSETGGECAAPVFKDIAEKLLF